MKKTRFIALVLAVSLMIMGSGYAYWTETLVVTNKIDTGKLDVNFFDYQSWFYKTPDVLDKDSQYMKAGIDITDNDNALITVSKIYPGGYAEFKFTVKNEGTLPAKFTDEDLEYVTGNEALYNALKDNYTLKSFSNDTIGPNSLKEFYFTIKMPAEITDLEEVDVTMKLNLNWEQGIGK